MVTEVLLAAIQFVESGSFPVEKVPDGQSGEVGPYQIRECVIKDVNDWYKTHYTLEDARDLQKSTDICVKYLLRWGMHYKLSTKADVTPEVLARIWNGGPEGWHRVTTIMYWYKVKERMKLLLTAQLKEIDPRYRVTIKRCQDAS